MLLLTLIVAYLGLAFYTSQRLVKDIFKMEPKEEVIRRWVGSSFFGTLAEFSLGGALILWPAVLYLIYKSKFVKDGEK